MPTPNVNPKCTVQNKIKQNQETNKTLIIIDGIRVYR